MEAFETTGTVDEQNRLVLDQPLPFSDSSRVRVIVLSESNGKEQAAVVSEQGNIDLFEEIVDQLGDVLDASTSAPRPVIADSAVSRAGIYQDHP